MPRTKRIKPPKEIVINESATIKMRNEVVNGRYCLPLLEMKMLMALAGHIAKNEEEFSCYSIPLTELGSFMGLNENTQYTTIRNLARSLRRRELFFEWYATPTSKRKSWLSTGWFDHIQYDDEHMTINYQFASNIEPMLLQVQKAYVQLECKPLMAFKCMYSNRFLMLVMEWEKIQPKKISIDELRDMFQLTDRYKLFSDFKRFVIDPAIKEINALSDFYVKVTPLKTGRRLTDFKFSIKKKSKETIDVSAVIREGKLPADWEQWQMDMYEFLTSDENGIGDHGFLIPYITKNKEDLIKADIEYAQRQRAEGKVKKWSAFLRTALEKHYGVNDLISKRAQELEEQKRRNELLVNQLTGELTKEGVLAEQTAAFIAEQERLRKEQEEAEPTSRENALEKIKDMRERLKHGLQAEQP